MTKTLLALLISMFLGAAAHAQAQVDEGKLDAFAHAVARAEGFGTKGTIPTRYHNPGDIRAHKGVHYPGQIGLNHQGYVIFKNDEAGFTALKDILRRMVNGQSRFYHSDMTITNVAKLYAGGSRIWAKNVARILGVEPTTTLAALLQEDGILLDAPPPVLGQYEGSLTA